MSQKYLRELVEFAQKEVPLLEYSFQQASTHYALQEACQRQFKILTHMLHHIIYAAYENNITVAPVAAPPPVVVAPTPPPPVAPPASGLPALPPPAFIPQPALAPQPASNLPDVPIQPGVANVIITREGTKVISPSGATAILPPGEHVSLEAASGVATLPDAPPGVEQVVLPPGGGMSPEVLAALSSRTGQ